MQHYSWAMRPKAGVVCRQGLLEEPIMMAWVIKVLGQKAPPALLQMALLPLLHACLPVASSRPLPLRPSAPTVTEHPCPHSVSIARAAQEHPQESGRT